LLGSNKEKPQTTTNRCNLDALVGLHKKPTDLRLHNKPIELDLSREQKKKPAKSSVLVKRIEGAAYSFEKEKEQK